MHKVRFYLCLLASLFQLFLAFLHGVICTVHNLPLDGKEVLQINQ